jgi:multimeric flavodoxin WrbA
MNQRIVIIKGSPRQRGNSATLADQAAAGAREAGALVESFYLQNMNIQACDGCDACLDSGECIIPDDMQALYPKVLAADAIILASPIYWFNFTAQLKTCIDRWYALWNTQHDAFRNKRFGIILTYGDSDLYTSGAINAIYTFETMARFLHSQIAGWVYGSLSNVGDAQKHPELMEQAFQLGKQLASSVRIHETSETSK